MLSQNLNFSLNICSEIKPSLQLEKKEEIEHTKEEK